MAHEKLAKTVLREIPVSSIDQFLGTFKNASRDACGCGCGACGYGCETSPLPEQVVVDRYGHSGVTKKELAAAHSDIAGFKKAIKQQASKMFS